MEMTDQRKQRGSGDVGGKSAGYGTGPEGEGRECVCLSIILSTPS
jgi:hypothetical protein